MCEDGSTLSRSKLVASVRTALASQGLDIWRFNGHSFHIGAATRAAGCGIEDSFIQTLGRWKSPAFTTYIHTSRDTLLSVSSRLLSIILINVCFLYRIVYYYYYNSCFIYCFVISFDCYFLLTIRHSLDWGSEVFGKHLLGFGVVQTHTPPSYYDFRRPRSQVEWHAPEVYAGVECESCVAQSARWSARVCECE